MNSIDLKLCDIQGRLFELFAHSRYNVSELVKVFMTGILAENLDAFYNRMQWMGEEYLLQEVISENETKLAKLKEPENTEVLFWIGYIYRYWHYYTKEDSKQIFRQAPFETMKTNYLMFHTMAPEIAIDDLKEIFRQKR